MGSLDGLKILDFSTLLPGPYASLMLADMGAEVLKISSAGKYDLVMDYGPRVEGTDISACQAWLNRNKKTMFLNLKTQEAGEIVKKLIKEEGYDIILEQFRPGVMHRLGLGYEDLKETAPELIYCSLTGYGQTGPLRDAAGHDINYMSRSGIISHAGRNEGGPSLMNFQIADVAVGSLNSVIGILAAVYSRQNTGKGQYIDVAMLDGCVPFNSLDGASFLVSGKQPQREGELLNGGCMYDYYETSDGKYMSVGSLEPKFWDAFCRGIGREDLIAGTVRPDNVAEVKEQIRETFREKTQAEWIERFKEFDACVQPVMDLKEALLEDEQIQARGMVVDVPVPAPAYRQESAPQIEDANAAVPAPAYRQESAAQIENANAAVPAPAYGESAAATVKQMATAIKLSDTPCEYRFAGYPLGYHTREIIEHLGLDYEDLAEKGVFD